MAGRMTNQAITDRGFLEQFKCLPSAICHLLFVILFCVTRAQSEFDKPPHLLIRKNLLLLRVGP
jgi:hypothetical protein